jgi:polysaccharide export outer membrane protein
MSTNRPGLPTLWAVLAVAVFGTGCVTHPLVADGGPPEIPHELRKSTLPPYVIEPPDELLLTAVRLVPKPPYRIEPLDQLIIQVPEALPTDPITGIYPVEPEGTVNLGLRYGTVRVVGMTLEEAKAAVEAHLKPILKEPQALVALAQSRALQQIQGPHLVRPDGTVVLGSYGGVYVANMTIRDAKAAIEAHLSQFLLRPEIAVDVIGMNSKVYYIVSDNAGFGATIVRRPITGNETVLDALSDIGGLPAVSSKKRIWIARPAPAEICGEQILPVDFRSIVKCAHTATNYQLLPGDRLYIHSDPLICTDNYLQKVFAPVERIFGIAVFGQGALQSFRTNGNGGFFGGGGGNVTNVNVTR